MHDVELNLSSLIKNKLLKHYTPAFVIIDENGTIIYIDGRTSRFLEFASEEAHLFFMDMIRPELKTKFHTAIHQASEQQKEIILNNIQLNNEQIKYFDVAVKPLKTEYFTGQLFLITFEEAATPLEKEKMRKQKALVKTAQPEQELKYTKNKLQIAIEELETSNKKLTSSNEALQLTNETFQEELSTINTALEDNIEQLSSAKEDIKNLLYNTEIATIFLDKNLCIKRFTPNATEIINLIPTDIGRPISHIVSNLHYEELVDDAKAVLQTLEPLTNEAISKKKVWYLIRIIPYQTTTNLIDGVVITCVNIHTQKQTEDKLNKWREVLTSYNRELKYQNTELEYSFYLINNLFQSAHDSIAALDNELNFKIINESFVELFSKIVITKINVGMNLIKILDDFPELKSKIAYASGEALKGIKTVVKIESHVKNVDVYYCYELCFHSFSNPEYRKNGLVFRIKNLTDYKLEERSQHKWQSEIALSCRTSAMGEMASALAHEINQPLTAIATYSRSCHFIMKNKSNNKIIETKVLETLEKIALQAELAGEIVHNMKNLMREGTLYVEETDINLLINNTISILYYELLDYKLKITLKLMDNPPKIMTNKIHIMQILLNLARNSIEAFQNSFTREPELIIETHHVDNYIHIHVRDNGPGIAPEYQNKILNTYFTTKQKGTGIGLGICRTLIEEHGGKLSIQQHENKGAWFTFTLPINKTV